MTDDAISKFIIVLMAGALAWGLWKAAQPRRLFTIRIVNGNPQAIDGTVTASFLTRIKEVAAAEAIQRGTITGHPHGGLVRLRFSRELPETTQQQLRNWWASFGWNAPSVRQTSCRS